MIDGRYTHHTLRLSACVFFEWCGLHQVLIAAIMSSCIIMEASWWMALIFNMRGYLCLRDNTGAHEDEIIRRLIIVLETAYSLLCFTMLRPTLHGHTKVGTVARIKMTSKLLEAKSMHDVSEFILGMYLDDRSVPIGSYLGILYFLSRGYRVNGTRRWLMPKAV